MKAQKTATKPRMYFQQKRKCKINMIATCNRKSATSSVSVIHRIKTRSKHWTRTLRRKALYNAPNVAELVKLATRILNSTSIYGRRCKHLNVRIYLTQQNYTSFVSCTGLSPVPVRSAVKSLSSSSSTLFTARCYASAVLAVGLCLSVCVCVCHKWEFY